MHRPGLAAAMPAARRVALAALLAFLPALAFGAVKAVPAKRTDSMVAKQQGQVIEIQSPSGIGSGQVTRIGGSWPKAMAVHLKGFKELEHFRVTAGDLTLLCTLERPGGVTAERVCRLGDAPVDAVSEAGDAFVVRLPPQLLTKSQSSLVVEWVDYWR